MGSPVSNQVASPDAGLLSADDIWTGTAADAYRQTLPLQRAALQAVKTTISDGVVTVLKP